MINGLSADEIEKNMSEQGGGDTAEASAKIKDRIEKINKSIVLKPLLRT